MNREILNIRLYSISEAAREMHIGKTSLYSLIEKGRIGTLTIGSHRKISHTELCRFISENTFAYDSTVNCKDVEQHFISKDNYKSKRTETDNFIQKLRGEF